MTILCTNQCELLNDKTISITDQLCNIEMTDYGYIHDSLSIHTFIKLSNVLQLTRVKHIALFILRFRFL